MADWSASGSNALVRRRYTRDASALIHEISDNYSGTKRFDYDPGERLRQVLHQRGPVEKFEYDAAGNLTNSVTDEAGGIKDEVFVYGAGNRLLNRGSTHYEYDAQGRLVIKIEDIGAANPKTWRYQWDALDQLCSVTRPDGEVWRYGYDALGRRVRKVHLDEEVRFVWNGSVPIHELSVHDQTWTSWIFGQESFIPLAQAKNGDTYSIFVDHLGTPQEMADCFGAIVWRFRSKAYGAESVQSGKDGFCPFRFQGQYYDAESGLHYNMFRYYDSDVGRFISQDPIGLVGGINFYQYVHDPMHWIDPMGLDDARPGKNLADEGGVRIVSHGTSDVDRPAHAHVTSAAGETRIGPNGKPIAGQRALTPQEKAVVAANLKEIRKELKKVGRAAARMEAKGELPGAEGSSKSKKSKTC